MQIIALGNSEILLLLGGLLRHRRVPLRCLALVGLLLFPPAARAGILDLAWEAPTTNEDKSELTDLDGYRVYVGTASLTPCPPGSTPQFVASATPAPPLGTVVTYRLTGLTEGTTYFVRVTAVDFGANESTCSKEASGPALPDPAPPSPNTDSGGGAGCFIATAAYGSSLSVEVQILRTFRDRALLAHAPGRFLVAAYYKLSPSVAALIRQHEALRAAARAALWPVVWGADLALARPELAMALGGGTLVAAPFLLLVLRGAWRALSRRGQR